MAEIDRIEQAIREHVEKHKDRERAMFTVAGVSALLDELSRRSEVIERAKEALTEALVAMKLASALPGVSNEYDFEPGIATVRALLQGESNG